MNNVKRIALWDNVNIGEGETHSVAYLEGGLGIDNPPSIIVYLPKDLPEDDWLCEDTWIKMNLSHLLNTYADEAEKHRRAFHYKQEETYGLDEVIEVLQASLAKLKQLKKAT